MFYNPAMAGDRDIAVAFARARFPAGGATGWEMLAATGVRGLRLLNESGGFRSMRLTEAHPAAGAVLLQNAHPYPAAHASVQDARTAPVEAPYDYVELDPYGSPLPFLEAALPAVAPGGVIAVTATDLMVLGGAQPEACSRLYGARPVRGRLGPEGGLRILLGTTIRIARERGRRARVLLSYARGHHLRAYLELTAGLAVTPDDRVGEIDPESWTGPRLGAGGPFGPMWLGPLADRELVHALRVPSTAAQPAETARLVGVLQEEAEVDRPFYYEANVLAGDLGLSSPAPKSTFLDSLRAAGFKTASTHMRPEGFRTEAPRPVVEEVARSWDAASPRTRGSSRSSARPGGLP